MYFKTFFKKTHLLILLMAIFMPWQVRAQETKTVYDGSATSQYIPMYGNYFDDYTKSECIIPATELTDMEGGTITAITFYAETVGTRTWEGTNQKVFLKEVSGTTLGGSYSGMTDAVIVFDGLLTMPTTSTDGYTITFSEEYVYNGGNLLIGVYNDDDGSYNNVKWYGVNNLTSGVSAYGYNSSNLANVGYNAQGFLPKTTFTYNPAGGASCTKPQSFNATGITAHEATLTWTAGDEESDWDVYVTTDSEVVPDDDTTPTYQVAECTKALTELTAQTTYYAYVRANCGGGDLSKWAKKVFSTTREALVVDQNHPYSQNFETNNDWEFTNGTLTNIWCYGSATNNGGSKAMYVSNDNGTSNAYTLNSTTTVFASKLLAFAQGTYTVSFDWKANGEANSSGTHYDYMRVALVPGDVEFTAGTSLPSGVSYSSLPSTWIALDGGHQLDLSESWQSQTAEAAVNGTYTMVFIWRNDSGSGNQPPAAIDNISISYMTCPRPTLNAATNVAGRTATISWTENGTANNWVLQYATNNTFTENLSEVNVSGTPSKDLTGLTPETKYYARVKSVLGSDESSWSDVKDFTTLATCPKPTLSYVSYSVTAYTGSVSWTGSTADAYEVAYRPKNDFDPSDMTLTDVTRVQLENVSEYTYTLQNLTPETKYYIYIQANCGTEDGVSSWSNRVTFTTLATCLAPSSLTFDGATSTSVTFHWTKGAEDQDAWQIRYKKATESEYTYLLVENHSSNSYTLPGLEPSTEYKVNVRAYCSSTDQSKWSYADQSYDLSVATECGALTLPYTYGFETNLLTTSPFSSSYPFPKCWNRIDYQSGYPGSYTYYPRVFTATYSNPYAHGGNGANSTSGHSMRFYQTSGSTNECAVLPEISGDYDMDKIQIRFWAAVQSSSGTLSVGIMDSPGDASTYTKIQDVTVSNTVSSGFQEFTVPFSSYEGSGRYIAFMCGTGSSYAYFLIDDITVELIPTCWVPTALTVKETSYNSASLTWTAGKDETEWNIQYKKSSDSEWSTPIHVTELPTNENPYVLSGLKRGTDYDVRVQAYCSADDQSEWCNPISFITDCGIWTIDNDNALFEGFSGDAFPPACWNWIRVENNGWQRSVNIYNPIDVTGTAYSYWPSGDTYLILPQMHIDGTPRLTFDMVFQGDGSGQEALVVLSKTGYSASNFTITLWEAAEFTSNKTSVDIDLSAYNGWDVYIAFLYKGVGTGGRTWYVDNVRVYCTSYPNEVQGYSTDTDGWRLIASPLAETILANDVLNMTSGDFDLYRFDQSADNQWENWKSEGSGHYHFGIEPGRGYLYARNDNTTITFIGTVYSGDGVVTLHRDSGSQLAGWNLIGNPFAQSATVAKDFYVMNNDGSGLIAADGHNVAAMEGIMVYAETDGETVTFVKDTRNADADAQIVLNLSRYESEVIDRVIVRFGEGGTLPKYSLNDNNAKVYITQDGVDYAIARGCDLCEMPVSFKANHVGKYTFSANVETADVSYLHLVDKITGDDFDMLDDGSYTFIGSPTDMEARFVLRFNSNIGNADTDVIAYQNGDEIVVKGEGTLQVFDVLGRLILTQRVNGEETMHKSLLQTGVYVFRIVGNSVKTQKVIVR